MRSKYSEQPVHLRLAHSAGRYRIEVSDQGIGIPRHEQASVFKPFFRASNTSGRPGHGLGLCFVKVCIERQGGRVHFHSELNKGTVFVIELASARPLAAPPQDREKRAWHVPGGSATGAEKPSPVPRPGSPPPNQRPAGLSPQFMPSTPAQPAKTLAAGRLRGIIVDGEALERRVLRDLLELDHDIEILGEAATLAQARHLAKRCKPNVVLLAVKLPDGLGFDLLACLKPDVSVVFVTSADHYAVHAFDCGAVDYILKPVDGERLRQALSRVRERLSTPGTPAAAPEVKPGDTILIKTLHLETVVKVPQIRSIIAYGEYSRVHWDVGKSALLRKPLKRWESELPAEEFARVHRHAIVNLAFIESVVKDPPGRLQIRVQGMEEPIQISLRKAPALNRRLKALHG